MLNPDPAEHCLAQTEDLVHCGEHFASTATRRRTLMIGLLPGMELKNAPTLPHFDLRSLLWYFGLCG
jgi:hypothetical protein